MTVKPVLWMAAVVGLLASPSAGAGDKVSIIMSWVAEAEHGGFYQALAKRPCQGLGRIGGCRRHHSGR
jgi:hypothetical protein